MKQTIEIEVPDGKKAVWKDGKVVFEDITPQLPKTWEEFCSKYQNSEYYIDDCSDIKRLPLGHLFNKHYDRNLLPSIEAAKAHLALIQLHQLRDCYRQGWKPDWSDNSTINYYIGHCAESYCIFTSSITPAFLTFQTEKLAEEFLHNFRNFIVRAGDLI